MSTQDIATQTALDAWADRVDRQLEAQQLQQRTPQPTLYAGGGRILPLGASGSLPARGTTTTGGLAIGDPVGNTQGLIGAMPSLDTVNRQIAADFRQVYGSLGEVAINRGVQLGTANPNDLAGGGETQLARYPYDLYYWSQWGALYYWEPSTPAQAGTWVALLQQASGAGDPDTVAPVGVVVGGTYTDTTTGQAYTWDGAAWVAQGGGANIQMVAGDPNAEGTTPAAGTLAVDTLRDRLFYWDSEQLSWVPAANKTFLILNDLAGSISDPYVGDLAQQADGLLWTYDGVSWWPQWFCQDCTELPADDPAYAGYSPTGSNWVGWLARELAPGEDPPPSP